MLSFGCLKLGRVLCFSFGCRAVMSDMSCHLLLLGSSTLLFEQGGVMFGDTSDKPRASYRGLGLLGLRASVFCLLRQPGLLP